MMDLSEATSFIMDFEAGQCDQDAIVTGFQGLIDNGMVWKLQGFYGRTAADLIAANLCHPKTVA